MATIFRPLPLPAAYQTWQAWGQALLSALRHEEHIPVVYWNRQEVQLVSSPAVPGIAAPTLTTVLGNIPALYFADAATQAVWFALRLAHGWLEETDIKFVVPWFPTSGAAGVVRWSLEYSWANEAQVLPAATTITLDSTSPGVTNTITRAVLPTIAGAGKKIGSTILGVLSRIGGHANDTYAASVGLSGLDLITKIDLLGSYHDGAKGI